MTVICLIPCEYEGNRLISTMKWLGDLNPQPDCYVFLVGCQDKLSEAVLRRFEFNRVILRNPFPATGDLDNPFMDISFARQVLLNYARSDPDSTALFIDSDIEPTSDVIDVFNSINGDVVSAPIFFANTRILNGTGAATVLIKNESLHDVRLNFYPAEGKVAEDVRYLQAARKLGYRTQIAVDYEFVHHKGTRHVTRPWHEWEQQFCFGYSRTS